MRKQLIQCIIVCLFFLSTSLFGEPFSRTKFSPHGFFLIHNIMEKGYITGGGEGPGEREDVHLVDFLSIPFPQLWKIQAKNGSYSITSLTNKKYLDYDLERGAKIKNHTEQEYSDQRWILQAAGKNIYRILPAADTGFCLSAGEKGKLLLLPCKDNELQLWKITELFNQQEMEIWQDYWDTHIRSVELFHKTEREAAAKILLMKLESVRQSLGEENAMTMFIKVELINMLAMMKYYDPIQRLIKNIMKHYKRPQSMGVITPVRFLKLHLILGEIHFFEGEYEKSMDILSNASSLAKEILNKKPDSLTLPLKETMAFELEIQSYLLILMARNNSFENFQPILMEMIEKLESDLEYNGEKIIKNIDLLKEILRDMGRKEELDQVNQRVKPLLSQKQHSVSNPLLYLPYAAKKTDSIFHELQARFAFLARTHNY